MSFYMIPTASLNLDEQLCFALYAATTQIVRAYRGPLATLGLTYPQIGRASCRERVYSSV